MCQYCQTDRDGYSSCLPRKGQGQVCIWKPALGTPQLEVSLANRKKLTVDIAFCPMCGRKLTAMLELQNKSKGYQSYR